MKMFALLLMIVVLPGQAAVIDGCYRTISYNGSPVIEGPEAESNLTRIYSLQSHYYFNASFSPLQTTVISIFKGFNGGWYSFINPIIFNQLGNTQESDTEWSHQFEGFVKYKTSYYSYDEADFLTEARFEWREDGRLYGSIQQHTKVLDRLMDFEVVLEKAVCPID